MVINIEKVIANLKENDNIVLLCHKSPDGDTIGSAFGLMYILLDMGKNVRVECEDEFPKGLIFAVGEYEIPEFEPSYVISVDISDVALMGEEISKKYADRVDMAIDHHRTHKSFAKEEYVVPTAAATAEIIYYIAKEMKIDITKRIANSIYLGLATDTGCFKYSNVTKNTFYAAGDLSELGADTAIINKRVFDTKSRKRVEIEGIVASSIEYYFDDKCAIVKLPFDFAEKHGADDEDMAGVTNIPRQIEGVEISAIIKEKDDGICKISVRAEEYINAALVCNAFDGGGHYAAAGCRIEGNLDTAKEKLLAVIEKRLREVNVI